MPRGLTAVKPLSFHPISREVKLSEVLRELSLFMEWLGPRTGAWASRFRPVQCTTPPPSFSLCLPLRNGVLDQLCTGASLRFANNITSNQSKVHLSPAYFRIGIIIMSRSRISSLNVVTTVIVKRSSFGERRFDSRLVHLYARNNLTMTLIEGTRSART